jgi:hypothetical protein
MVRRSHKHHKQFRCGHRGFGQFCHRCIQVDQPAPCPRPKPSSHLSTSTGKSPVQQIWRAARQHAAKQQWQQSFAHDPIDLTHLPKPIVVKARKILQALHQGTPPATLKGKRFNFDRTLLRIAVTYRYRLLCRWYGDRIIPLQVLSHEAYNAIAHHKKRLNS